MKSLEEFMGDMRIHLKEIESIADDLDQMGSRDGMPWRQQQETLNKAARLYDALGGIWYDMRQMGYHA